MQQTKDIPSYKPAGSLYGYCDDCRYEAIRSGGVVVKCMNHIQIKGDEVQGLVKGHDSQWFLDRIGKRIYRDEEENGCDCRDCKEVVENGLVIHDENHANYLHSVEHDFGSEGIDLNYRDTPESIHKFSTTLEIKTKALRRRCEKLRKMDPEAKEIEVVVDLIEKFDKLGGDPE